MYYIYLSVAFILINIVGIIVSKSDLKYGKVFNKHLLYFLCIGVVINLLYVGSLVFVSHYIRIEALQGYIINLLTGIFISVLFYYIKVWAAGDAKLFCLFLFLVPYESYSVDLNSIFPGFYFLIAIFSLAFIYITIETIILFVKDIYKGNMDFGEKGQQGYRVNWKLMKNFITQYLLACVLSFLLNDTLTRFFENFYMNNKGFVMLINILLLILLLNYLSGKHIYKLILGVGCVYVLVRIILHPVFPKTNYILLLVFVLVILARYLGAKYNYIEVPTQTVKAGMVLSTGTVFLFQNSKVKGLPLHTNETTDSRITEEEAESIKRWEKSKYGQEEILIVRHVPFAPFIYAGVVIQLCINIWSSFIK